MQQSVASLFNLYLERSDFREATVEFKQRTLNRFTDWFGELGRVGQMRPGRDDSQGGCSADRPVPYSPERSEQP